MIGPFLFKTMTTIEDKNIPSKGGQVLIQVQLIQSLPFVKTAKTFDLRTHLIFHTIKNSKKGDVEVLLSCYCTNED